MNTTGPVFFSTTFCRADITSKPRYLNSCLRQTCNLNTEGTQHHKLLSMDTNQGLGAALAESSLHQTQVRLPAVLQGVGGGWGGLQNKVLQHGSTTAMNNLLAGLS